MLKAMRCFPLVKPVLGSPDPEIIDFFNLDTRCRSRSVRSVSGWLQTGLCPGPDSCLPYYESIYTYYVRGQDGQVLAEYTDLYGPPTARYIYAGSQRIAMIDGSDSVYYYLNDDLGSAGILMTASGTVRDRYRYQAFGGVDAGQSVNL